MIKEILYGLLIGGVIIGVFEFCRPKPHTCITPKKVKSITDNCDRWEKRVTCYNGDEWDFKYDKSSL